MYKRTRKRRMPKNAAELQESYLKLESWTLGPMAKQVEIEATIMLCGYIEELVVALRRRPRHQQSAWQRFFGAGIKAGKTPQQVGAEWRSRRSA